MTLSFEEQEERHQQARDETGFWGRQGSGCVIFARDTGRYLIQLRSDAVLQPGTWGSWGGAVDDGLTPEENVYAELEQETGLDTRPDLHFLVDYVDEDSGFRYRNYLAVVEQEFTPTLNWEGAGFQWCELGAWPDELHFGLEYLISQVPNPAESVGITMARLPR